MRYTTTSKHPQLREDLEIVVEQNILCPFKYSSRKIHASYSTLEEWLAREWARKESTHTDKDMIEFGYLCNRIGTLLSMNEIADHLKKRNVKNKGN